MGPKEQTAQNYGPGGRCELQLIRQKDLTGPGSRVHLKMLLIRLVGDGGYYYNPDETKTIVEIDRNKMAGST